MSSQLTNLISTCIDPKKDKTPKYRLLHPSTTDFDVKERSCSLFWEGFCELLSKRDKREISESFGLSEIVYNVTPLVFTFNFVFSGNNKHKHYITDEYYRIIILNIQDVINEHLEISKNEEEFTCCVLQSEENIIDSKNLTIIEQMRLHFPKCKVDKEIFTDVIIPSVIKKLKQIDDLNFLDKKPNNRWEKIILENTNFEEIPLYGSTVKENYPVLVLTECYGRITKEQLDPDNMEEVPDTKQIRDVFSKTEHFDVKRGRIQEYIFEDINDTYYWIPLLLSINYCQKETLTKNSSEDCDQDYLEPIDKEVNEYLKMLDPKRFRDKYYWNDVARCIYSIYKNNNEKGIDILTKYTVKNSKKTRDDCEEHYTSELKSFLTIKTLAWYAREDNPSEYYKYRKTIYQKYLERALSLSHNDIAKLFYKIFWLDFACTMPGTGLTSKWFAFYNHRWNKVLRGSDIRIKLSNELLYIIVKYKKEEEEKGEKTKEHLDKLKILKTLIDKLGNRSFCDSIVSFLSDIFHNEDKDFDKKIDDNESLTGMENGIIEVMDDEVPSFRRGKPEDFISKNTGTCYCDKYHLAHPKVREFQRWLKETYEYQEVIDYRMKWDASGLRAGNHNQLLMCHTGPKGSNSKTEMKNFKHSAWGRDYAGEMPLYLLRESKKEGGPDPVKWQLKGTRWASITEPSRGRNIGDAELKRVVGNEEEHVRDLNESGCIVKATYKTEMYCNAVPAVDNPDSACVRRLRSIPYTSLWVHKHDPRLPKDYKDQEEKRVYQIDMKFSKKARSFKEAYFWLLVNVYYLRYEQEGLVEPIQVKETTDKYWEENDPYKLWTFDRVEDVWFDTGRTVLDDGTTLSSRKAYKDFCIWFKEVNGHKNDVPSRPTFREAVCNLWGYDMDEHKRWKGKKLKGGEGESGTSNMFI